MVKDAEAHAEEDRKLHDLVTVRNQADNMIHASEKAIKDADSKKITAEEKQQITDAISNLKEALKGNDKTLIESKLQVLQEASHKLAEHMYQQAAQAQQSTAQTTADNSAAASSSGDSNSNKDKGNTVDAEFEEIKDKK